VDLQLQHFLLFKTFLLLHVISRFGGLLQLGTLWRASQQHPEVAACAEQCSQNRPPDTEAVL